jgi:hypothetical protein
VAVLSGHATFGSLGLAIVRYLGFHACADRERSIFPIC